MTAEAQAVANKLGITFRVSIDGAERFGKQKTSMLQDIEAGRAQKIGAPTQRYVMSEKSDCNARHKRDDQNHCLVFADRRADATS